MLIGTLLVASLLVVGLWWMSRRPGQQKERSSEATDSKQYSAGQAAGGKRRSGALPNVEKAGAAVSLLDDGSGAPAAPLPEALRDLQLLSLEHIEAAARDQIDALCGLMAEPHPIQTKLAGGLDSPEELMEAVVTDAGLTASVLRTVNSAAFALASPITSVQHAVTYLGVAVVKGIVAQAAMAERAGEGTEAQQAALARIWKSACAASAVALALAQEFGVQRPSVLATKALFANLGDVVTAMHIDDATDWYAANTPLLNRVVEQQRSYGANSAVLGMRLANAWGLPQDIAESIGTSLLVMAVPPTAHPLVGDALRDHVLVYLAGRLGDRVAYQGLDDISEFSLFESCDTDMYYVADYLKRPGLERNSAIFSDASFNRKVNRQLATLT